MVKKIHDMCIRLDGVPQRDG